MNRYEPQSVLTQERPRRRLWLWMILVSVAAILLIGAIFAFPYAAFMA